MAQTSQTLSGSSLIQVHLVKDTVLVINFPRTRAPLGTNSRQIPDDWWRLLLIGWFLLTIKEINIVVLYKHLKRFCYHLLASGNYLGPPSQCDMALKNLWRPSCTKIPLLLLLEHRGFQQNDGFVKMKKTESDSLFVEVIIYTKKPLRKTAGQFQLRSIAALDPSDAPSALNWGPSCVCNEPQSARQLVYCMWLRPRPII